MLGALITFKNYFEVIYARHLIHMVMQKEKLARCVKPQINASRMPGKDQGIQTGSAGHTVAFTMQFLLPSYPLAIHKPHDCFIMYFISQLCLCICCSLCVVTSPSSPAPPPFFWLPYSDTV